MPQPTAPPANDPAPPGTPPPTPGQPTPPEPPPTNPDPPADPPAQGSGAEDRIRQLNAKAKAEAERAKALEAELSELKKAQMTELERAQTEAKEAAERAATLEAENRSLTNGALVRAAAAAENFANPENAVAMLDLKDLDTEAKAKKAVENLKSANPHLIRQAGQQATGFGNLGGAGQPPPPTEVPLDGEGKPDVQLGLGRELLRGLMGR